MRTVEEFQSTQNLINEYNELENKIPTLETKIEDNRIKAEDKIERLQEEMQPTAEDIEFNINRDEVVKIYQGQIDDIKAKLEEDNKSLTDEIEESKNAKKYFGTDEHFKTITMEIEAMKKEVARGQLELKKKDIELQEFYAEENHENPLKWQEIYKEQDELRKNIRGLETKIDEYSKFKDDLYRNLAEPELTEPELEELEPLTDWATGKVIDPEIIEQKVEDKKPEEMKSDSENLARTYQEKIAPKPDPWAMWNYHQSQSWSKKPEQTKPEQTKSESMKPEFNSVEEQRKREEALAWEEHEKSKKQEENPEQTLEEKEAIKKWLNGEELEPVKPEKTNPGLDEPQIEQVTISPITNTIICTLKGKDGKQIDVFNELNYSMDTEKLKEILEKNGIEVPDTYKIDPNIVNLLDQAGCKKQLLEYTKTIVDDSYAEKLPFNVQYDLKDIYQSELLYNKEKSQIVSLANDAKLKGAQVSKDNILKRAFQRVKSLVSKHTRKALVEDNKNYHEYAKHEEKAIRNDRAKFIDSIMMHEKYEKYKQEKNGRDGYYVPGERGTEASNNFKKMNETAKRLQKENEER